LPPVGGIWLPEKRKLFDFSMDYRPSEKWGEMTDGALKSGGKDEFSMNAQVSHRCF